MLKTIWTLGACAAALVLPGAAQGAELFYGVTGANRLVQFTSDAPNAVAAGPTLRGLAEGEQVVGLDVRPQTNGVYALGASGRLYLVNPANGAARALGGGFTPPLAGSAFGFDFNPQVDRIRVVSDTGQNLRVNPDTGAVQAVDGPLQYAADDPGAGTAPLVTGSAYTSNVPAAPSTVLFGIDTGRDALVRQDPPNDGTLRTVGPLGLDVTDVLGFDVAASDGTAYAAVNGSEGGPSSLVRVDLETGAARPVPNDPAILVPARSRAGLRLRALATAGRVPDDRRRPVASLAFSSTVLEANTRVLRPRISCGETCAITVRAFVDGRRAGRGTGAVVGGPGKLSVPVRLSRAARRRIARPGTELIVLQVAVVDAAGNVTRLRKRARTQTLAVRAAGGAT